MSDNETMIPAASEEFEALLPEGWAEGDDIFDVDSWAGGQMKADESSEGAAEEEDTEAVEDTDEDSRATEQSDDAEESQDDGEEALANEQNPARPKLRFSTQIDHKMEDVELE